MTKKPLAHVLHSSIHTVFLQLGEIDIDSDVGYSSRLNDIHSRKKRVKALQEELKNVEEILKDKEEAQEREREEYKFKVNLSDSLATLQFKENPKAEDSYSSQNTREDFEEYISNLLHTSGVKFYTFMHPHYFVMEFPSHIEVNPTIILDHMRAELKERFIEIAQNEKYRTVLLRKRVGTDEN